jgi:hypothetical protein
MKGQLRGEKRFSPSIKPTTFIVRRATSWPLVPCCFALSATYGCAAGEKKYTREKDRFS